jgi:phosphoglycolate phosphatase
MLRIGNRLAQPRLAVFDKDGTLMAFERLWHTWFRYALRILGDRVTLGDDLSSALAGTLGYDPEMDAWDPAGPLTIASTGEVALLIAGQVYRYGGMDWTRALTVVQQATAQARAELPLEELVEPIGDVQGTLASLHGQGILLAVATTDDRADTMRGLCKLGIADLFSVILCGDDGIPLKPDPEMALEICRRLSVAPTETIMVGDTVADLEMARRAGYALVVGVSSGASSAELLAQYADVVISDINAIEISTLGQERSDA